jgi:tRNA threonylcarbamoyl adenosine modification protein YeaZ
LARDALILAFDTSAAHCAAALLWGERVLAARHEDMAKGQAEALFPLLDDVLAEAGVSFTDLHALAVGTGPGNFTGTRIAVAAARGLALALNIPAVGVTRFEALAFGLPRPLCVLENARRGEIYGQEFGDTGVDGPWLLDPSDLRHAITATCITGSAAESVAAQVPALTILPQAYPLAEAIARVAATRWQTPALPRPAPLYLRPADAAPARNAPPPILG